jgi:hypothetical protein
MNETTSKSATQAMKKYISMNMNAACPSFSYPCHINSGNKGQIKKI